MRPWQRGKPACSPRFHATEERLVGLVEPRQHIRHAMRAMRAMRVDGLILRKRSAELLAFGILLRARDGDTPPLVGSDAARSGRVGQGAAMPHHRVTRSLLCHSSVWLTAIPLMLWAQAGRRLTTGAVALFCQRDKDHSLRRVAWSD